VSFRKKRNRYDEWIAHRIRMSDLFSLFLCVELDSLNQSSFEEYLTDGNNKNFHTPVTELSDELFLKLEKIVNDWESFDFGFDVFYSERTKRFKGYG
jgi:hypothetical protein